MRRNTKILFFIVILILFAFMLFKPLSLQANTIPLIQYVGEYYYGNENLNPEYRYRNQVLTPTAKFGDIEVTSEKSYHQVIYGCLNAPADSLHPVKTTVDSNGCQHWTIDFVETGSGCINRGQTYNSYCTSIGYDSGVNGGTGYSCNYGYAICSKTTRADYGGNTRVVDEYYGCWGRQTVKKAGVVIVQTNWTHNPTQQYKFDNGLVATMQMNPTVGWGACIRYENQYYWQVPADAITYDFEGFTTTVLQDSVPKVNLILHNNFYASNARVNITMRIPIESFGGVTRWFTDSVSYDKELPLGDTIISLDIPTAHVDDDIYITPVVQLYLPKTAVSGVNKNCYSSQYNEYFTMDIAKCPDDAIVYATLTIDEQKIRIVPKPTYLTKPAAGCSSYKGYIETEFDPTVCIRDDISYLSCVQLGCPTITVNSEPVAYMCMSDGRCSQFVSQAGCKSDADCVGLGAVCRKNSDNINFCVKTELQDVIKYHEKPIYMNMTCNDISAYCNTGYTCQDKSVDGKIVGICELTKTLIIPGETRTITQNNTIITPGKNIVIDTSSSSPYMKYLVLAVIVIVGLIIIIALRKRR